MKKFLEVVKALCAIGFVVSVIICFFCLPLGIVLALVNLIAMSSAEKQLKELEGKK